MKFQFHGQELVVEQRTYNNNGRLAILFADKDGMTYATLSTNIVDVPMADGEFAVKNYSENQELAAAAWQSGLFVDTGRRVSSGYVTNIPVWRLKSD